MINLKLIYNPSAGMQTQQEKAFLIARKLTESGDFRVSIFATKKKNDAYIEAKKACEEVSILFLPVAVMERLTK